MSWTRATVVRLEVWAVDVSVVQSTDTPTLTRMTCTGLWLPVVSDYAERLLVRADRRLARLKRCCDPRGGEVGPAHCDTGPRRCQREPRTRGLEVPLWHE